MEPELFWMPKVYKLRHWPPGTNFTRSCRLFFYWPVFTSARSQREQQFRFKATMESETVHLYPTKGGGVTVSTGLDGSKRHAGVWAPIIARKTILANNNLALAA